ncbi:ABC transporter substrate-binding protein [Thiomicrorhabdus sediminis]|uniref:SsuA/THI5-like domain-containing protein n=1 Tax=Thiomicrorhabdus sediminis TaxID=2580412 RepID=A0A4P9K4R2_9GAMM|nr:ABC transporter substrate-binding protein [Thiomicrorhabdus sediminis]QCU89197.1 hypothetical protein FE785_00425 [Thiomicrorhabdus sediminis]
MKLKLVLMLVAVFLVGCSEQKPPVKVLSNAWIGFTPLFYAQEKGWLKEANIELSTVVSLGESMMIFSSGDFDGMTGTQYEFNKLKSKQFDMVPVVMFDRSNGGDMVMGNIDIDTLRSSDQAVDVVLEINSINMPLFQDFVRRHHLENVAFNFINKDQSKLVSYIKQQTDIGPTLAVTYIPYNFELQTIGFKILASTKDIAELLVLDALYVKRDSMQKNQHSYQKLAEAVQRALKDLHENPKVYYELVKHYLENPSYKEFKASLADIEWLSPPFSEKLQNRMQQIDFPYQDIM